MSQPTCSARNCSAPSAAEHQSRHGATSAKLAGTMPFVIPREWVGQPSGADPESGSAGAGEPVVVGAALGPVPGLLGFLLRLGLHDAGLAGHGGGGVAVRLAVDLLG